MAIRFKVKLEQYEDTQVLHAYLPFDVYEAFGTRARMPVKGTINGFAFRNSIFPMGPMGGGKFYLVVNKQMREGAKVKAGDLAEFRLKKDDTPREIETPADFAKAMKANKDAQAVWDRLSFTHRKEYIGAIEEAKKPETRARRIEKAVETIAAMKKAEAKKPVAKTAKKSAPKTAKKASKKSASKQ
ncbi:MAG: YdeI/OmpD-associated family protein [Blastocatellia bacterium]